MDALIRLHHDLDCGADAAPEIPTPSNLTINLYTTHEFMLEKNKVVAFAIVFVLHFVGVVVVDVVFAAVLLSILSLVFLLVVAVPFVGAVFVAVVTTAVVVSGVFCCCCRCLLL